MKTSSLIDKLMVCFFCVATSGTAVARPVQNKPEHRLMVLAPGHFHADLLQKTKPEKVSDTVFVYSPPGFELNQYLSRIESYNSRNEAPTSWKEVVYSGSDYLEKMIAQQKGDIVVIAGNNQNKANYIFESVNAGFNVLSDKPMAINTEQFALLEKSFKRAEQKGVMLYDIMTERYDVLNVLERLIISDREIFGELVQGSPENPAVELSSVHYFFKTVSGKNLIRAPWYYDVAQQGEGIVDVTTHLIDIVNWKCFPEKVLSYRNDVEMVQATHYPTRLTARQFYTSTQLSRFPEYLEKYLKDSVLHVYSNGTIQYKIKGINVAIRVVWNFEAPEGSGDTFTSAIRGTKSVCRIVQNPEKGSLTQLYISPVDTKWASTLERKLEKKVKKLQSQFPGLSLVKEGGRYRLALPGALRIGHEEHFSKVAGRFFDFLRNGQIPEWERSYMLTKYFITTRAHEMATKKDCQ